MTQEEKQLLLKDLCARLPYGVEIHINNCIEEQNQMRLFDVNLEGETIGVGNEKWAFCAIPIIDNKDEIKAMPYLRPMSSMTEEELMHEPNGISLDGYMYAFEAEDYIDWLLEHHFDYRGLIEKGLALEAPNDMYKQ